MAGIEALNYLRTQSDYTISDTPEFFLISWRGNPQSRIPKKAVEDGMTLKHLLKLSHRGFNVEHITRVTGYLSKTSGWNKGKVAELVDRNRSII